MPGVAIGAQLDKVRTLAKRFSSSKRALTDVQSSIDTVKASLDGLRTDLIELVDEVATELGPDPGRSGLGEDGGGRTALGATIQQRAEATPGAAGPGELSLVSPAVSQ